MLFTKECRFHPSKLYFVNFVRTLHILYQISTHIDWTSITRPGGVPETTHFRVTWPGTRSYQNQYLSGSYS